MLRRDPADRVIHMLPYRVPAIALQLAAEATGLNTNLHDSPSMFVPAHENQILSLCIPGTFEQMDSSGS